MTNYSTVSRVRDEAGFKNNENIPSSTIQQYLNKATAVVQSFVAKKYALSGFDTNFTGSQAESVLQRCEELIAAGNLLNKEYGYEEDGTGKGDYKIKEAMDTLKAILDGTMILLDSEGNEYGVSTTLSRITPSGSPVSSTDTNQDGDSMDRSFSISKQF